VSTIRDVARKAGVAISTVSAVVNRSAPTSAAVVARVERPVTVEQEVVDDGDEPGDHRGDAVLEAGAVHEQRVDGDVDDEAGAADESEADELQPVRRPTHPVHEPHVRLDVNRWSDAGRANIHGRGLVAHPSQVS